MLCSIGDLAPGARESSEERAARPQGSRGGTQTMQDVVTDIRAIPEEFSPSQSALRAALKGLARPSRKAADNDNEEEDDDVEENSDEDTSEPGSECEVMQQWEWLRGSSLTAVDESGVPIELKKYACGCMSRAAMNLLREVGPSLVKLHLAGYSIKVVGHSLGGAVAAMLTYLLISMQKWSRPLDVRCITYGCPSVWTHRSQACSPRRAW